MGQARRSTWSRGTPAWDRRERVAVRRLGLLTVLLALGLAPFGRPILAGAGPESANNQTVILGWAPTPGPAAAPAAVKPCAGTCLVPIQAAATPTITGTATPPANSINGTVRDVALLVGSAGATGTVTFRLFADAACATPPVFTSDNGLISGTGGLTATSDAFLVTNAGTYHWIAQYNGDANNTAASTSCADATQTLTVVKSNTIISTIASPQNAQVGASLTDTATVSGIRASGSVTFELFSDVLCTVRVFNGSSPLNVSNGMATSAPFTVTAPGTYHWVATYTGDANNSPSPPAPCNDLNEQVVVTPSSSTTSSSTSSTTSSTTSTSSTTTSTTSPSSTTSSSSSTSSTRPTSSTSSSTSSTSTSVPTGTSSTTPSSSTTSTSSPTSSTTTRPSSSTTSSTSASSTTTPSSSSTTTTAPTGTSSTTTSSSSTSTSSTSTTATSTATSTTATTGTTTTITAPGAATPAAVTTGPQVVAPGGSTTVTGSGFPAGKPVLVQLFSDPIYLATVNASSRGTFRLVVTIPRATPPGAHTVVATGPGGLARGTAPLTVSAPRTTTTLRRTIRPISAEVVPVATLARTGTSADRATRLAFILVLVGAVMVAAAWRSPTVNTRRRYY